MNEEERERNVEILSDCNAILHKWCMTKIQPQWFIQRILGFICALGYLALQWLFMFYLMNVTWCLCANVCMCVWVYLCVLYAFLLVRLHFNLLQFLAIGLYEWQIFIEDLDRDGWSESMYVCMGICIIYACMDGFTFVCRYVFVNVNIWIN